MSAMAERIPAVRSLGTRPAPTPVAALAEASLALTELVESVSMNGARETLTAQDVAILDAVRDGADAAYHRFQALRVGRTQDVALWTARLQVAAGHLREAALAL